MRRSNSKALETLALNLKQLNRIEGRTGWFADASYEDGTPVAYVAALNELGHGKTPPRPFMRPTIAEKRTEWIGIARNGAQEVLNNRLAPVFIMEQLTQAAEDDIKNTILAIYEPPLSPITIELRAMKKRNPNLHVTGRTVGIAAATVNKPGYQTPDVNTKPLVDTGFMIATLTHVVEKK